LSLREPGTVLNDDSVVERNAAVRVAQVPTAPTQGRSLALTYIVGGVFFSVLLGVSAVVVATMLQRSYILSIDAERDLGLPSLGDVEATVSGAPMVGVHPGYGLVAANLLRLFVDGKPLTMVQIASSSESDSSEVARALGTAFARAFAMRTLILDLRHPAEPAATAPPPRPRPPLTAAIPTVSTEEDDLWMSVKAHQALFGDRGRMPASAWQVISGLRSQFDMVLVTVSSSLADPMVHRLASIVDATVFVLYAEKTRAAIAERFREMTLEAGGNLAGFVFVGRRFYVPGWLYRRL